MIISFFDFLKKNTAGIVKKDIQIKLKEYVPITDKIWIKKILLEKLNEIKFQGKPDNINPLINSTEENIVTKIKTEEKLSLKFIKEQMNVTNP